MKKNIKVPKEWLYDPLYKINNDETTAMRLANYGVDIPKYWEHDSLLKDKYGKTVAMLLAENGKDIP